MDNSSAHLAYISRLVLEHMDSRDPVGGLSWMDVYPIEDAVYDVGRKFRLVDHVISNGKLGESKKVALDNILDLLGYAYILYYKVHHTE